MSSKPDKREEGNQPETNPGQGRQQGQTNQQGQQKQNDPSNRQGGGEQQGQKR